MAARVRLLLPVAAAAAAGTAGGVALTQAEAPLPLAALGLPRGGLAGVDGGTLQGLDPSKGLGVRAARARPALADVAWVRDLAAGAGAEAVFTADSLCCTPTYAHHLARPSCGPCLHASGADVKPLTLLLSSHRMACASTLCLPKTMALLVPPQVHSLRCVCLSLNLLGCSLTLNVDSARSLC